MKIHDIYWLINNNRILRTSYVKAGKEVVDREGLMRKPILLIRVRMMSAVPLSYFNLRVD